MRIALLAALLLASCDGGDSPAPKGEWSIGPIIKVNGEWKNYSVNCPKSFTGSFTIGPCEPHYVTKAGSQLPQSLIFTLDGNVEGVKCPPATISLYFETRDNDWYSDNGGRWWSGTIPLTPGTHTITAGRWRSTLGMTSESHPVEFAQAKANISKVGFTFGDCTGLGHGVKGSARFTVH